MILWLTRGDWRRNDLWWLVSLGAWGRQVYRVVTFKLFLVNFFLFKKFIYFFNWRIIALQNFDGFFAKRQHESAISQWLFVQFSRSVVSHSLRPHESQHTRPPCSSPTPGVHSDSHPSSQWCHPAISSSVVPFCSCPQSLPASVFSNELRLCKTGNSGMLWSEQRWSVSVGWKGWDEGCGVDTSTGS